MVHLTSDTADRLARLHGTAADLRAERRAGKRPRAGGPDPIARLRAALGRRLIVVGAALAGDVRVGSVVAR